MIAQESVTKAADEAQAALAALSTDPDIRMLRVWDLPLFSIVTELARVTQDLLDTVVTEIFKLDLPKRKKVVQQKLTRYLRLNPLLDWENKPSRDAVRPASLKVVTALTV